MIITVTRSVHKVDRSDNNMSLWRSEWYIAWNFGAESGCLTWLPREILGFLLVRLDRTDCMSKNCRAQVPNACRFLAFQFIHFMYTARALETSGLFRTLFQMKGWTDKQTDTFWSTSGPLDAQNFLTDAQNLKISKYTNVPFSIKTNYGGQLNWVV